MSSPLVSCALRAVLPLIALTGSLVPGAEVMKPNIVYLLIDDMGYDDAGFNGGKEIHTPNLDRLAKAGTVLKAFYVQPVCSPTRSALMTGRYPTHTGVYDVVRPGAAWGLPLNERLLPQALREVGYTTAICGKWHLGEFDKAYLPMERGFDHQYGHYYGALDYFTHIRDGKLDWYRDEKPLKEEGYSTFLIAKEAARLIQAQPADKPLFLYVPFNGVHSPYQSTESLKEPYKSMPTPRRNLAGALAGVDEAVGQIAAALTAKGWDKNTLIICSSDNGGVGPGTITKNTPLRAGKGTIYEGGLRSASFVNWPGVIPADQTIQEPLHVTDWYPTLLKLTGAKLEQPLPVDGCDIWPVLTQHAKTPHEALVLRGTHPGVAALRVGDWKLLLNATEKDAEDAEPGQEKSQGNVQLYNVVKDLEEQHDCAATEPERVKEMKERLDAILAQEVPAGSAGLPKYKNQKNKK